MAKVRVENGSVFERYEKKYLLNETQRLEIMESLGDRMQQDTYGLHTICSLYYDTEDFAIIRRCLEKPGYREKLRLRSYGIPTSESVVYLEQKKKLGQITYKRRMPITLSEAEAYFNDSVLPTEQGQIFREISWFASQRTLGAKLLVSYDRIALFGREDNNFRVTFDTGIRWRREELSLRLGDAGVPLLDSGACLMEVKTLDALPLWFARILTGFKLYPTSFSKYGTIYQEHLARKESV